MNRNRCQTASWRHGLVALAAFASLTVATNAVSDTVAVYNADLHYINVPLYVSEVAVGGCSSRHSNSGNSHRFSPDNPIVL